ncbi:hypothetical protein [Pseudoalteromonas galatheae]|uniref:hypothetical protein n=1 Tax=Pseudoalteromonas galatheae TaxID=579562 RepID=UPI0030D3E719
MEWFFGLENEIQLASKFVFIGAIAVFVIFSGKNANLRWLSMLMATFYIVDWFLVNVVIVPLVSNTPYGWISHVYNIAVNLFFIWLIYERPFISRSFGKYLDLATHRLFYLNYFIKWFLPSKHPVHFYRQENALARTITVACIAHGVMLLHYLLYVLGVTTPEGYIQKQGFDRYIVFQSGYTLLLMTLVVEVVVICYMTLNVVIDRLPNSSKTV